MLSSTNRLLPLELLRQGEKAEVHEVCGECEWVARMAELGLRVGCQLRVVRPGTPCLLEVNRCRLSVRAESFQILVRPLSSAG